ncbi:hypothetical protein GS909_21895 [Rhodococcus hoagii]|nr:hypothetical protein [Prescottella equi]
MFAGHIGGKLSVETTAPLDSQRALSIAYTPGVAQGQPRNSRRRDAGRSLHVDHRLVVVVSDGTAVLGLGDIGPARRCRSWRASRPVQELRASTRSRWFWTPGPRRDRRDPRATAPEFSAQ